MKCSDGYLWYRENSNILPSGLFTIAVETSTPITLCARDYYIYIYKRMIHVISLCVNKMQHIVASKRSFGILFIITFNIDNLSYLYHLLLFFAILLKIIIEKTKKLFLL